MAQEAQSDALGQSRGVGWPGREVQEEGNIGIPMADSCCCLTETIHCKATVL